MNKAKNDIPSMALFTFDWIVAQLTIRNKELICLQTTYNHLLASLEGDTNAVSHQKIMPL